MKKPPHKFCDAFTAVAIPIEWKHIEPEEGNYDWDIHDRQIAWAGEQKLLMSAGPLLDLVPRRLAPRGFGSGSTIFSTCKVSSAILWKPPWPGTPASSGIGKSPPA